MENIKKKFEFIFGNGLYDWELGGIPIGHVYKQFMGLDISEDLNKLHKYLSDGVYVIGYSPQEIYLWAKDNIPSNLIIYYIWKVEQIDQILIHDNWQIILSESFWKHDISLWQQLKEWGCIIL